MPLQSSKNLPLLTVQVSRSRFNGISAADHLDSICHPVSALKVTSCIYIYIHVKIALAVLESRVAQGLIPAS